MTETHTDTQDRAVARKLADATDARIVRTLGTGASVAVLFVVLRLLVAVLASACIALAITYGYPWVPVGAALIAAAILAIKHWSAEGVSGRTADFAVREVGSIAAVAVLLLAAVERTPRSPAERVHTKTGVVTAHVLKVESGFLTALTESDREVLVLNSSDVLRREPI